MLCAGKIYLLLDDVQDRRSLLHVCKELHECDGITQVIVWAVHLEPEVVLRGSGVCICVFTYAEAYGHAPADAHLTFASLLFPPAHQQALSR